MTLAVTLGGAAGCTEPMVDAVAIWVDGASDDAGRRHLRVYRAGERDSYPVVPDIPGTGLDLLEAGVDGRARGVATSAVDSTVWVDLDSGRQLEARASAVGREDELLPGFTFLASGDAFVRQLDVDDENLPGWLLAALAAPQGPHTLLLQVTEPSNPGLRWTLHHAADAPVIVLAEVSGSPVSARGRLRALAYPSTLGEGPVVEQLRPLGQGAMVARGQSVDVANYLPSFSCPDRLCVSPSGRQVFGMDPDGSCSLLRWTWIDAASAEVDVLVEQVPVACPDDVDKAIVAVLDDDLVVLDDPLRLFLVDATTGRLEGIPKPSGLLTARVVAQGRALVVVSTYGEVMRIDAGGTTLVNALQVEPCTVHDGLVVSPGGRWVLRACNGQSDLESGLDGQIQRISALGAELYSGVPMRPIAIDDEGNALLYSVASDDDDGVPRGLFVLGGDGQVTRVDELEPFPDRVMMPAIGGGFAPSRFHAAGPG